MARSLPGRFHRLFAGLIGLVLALALAGCGTGPLGDGSTHDVERAGNRLVLDDQPFRFVGFNLYDGAASDIYSCSPGTRLDDTALDAMLRYARDEAGATVIRFWAYQTYTAGGTDFSGIDRLIAAAEQLGMKVLPVLEDGPGYCSTGQKGVILDKADNGTWYADGYKQPYGTARLSLRDYAKVMAEHYRDNTTIAGWSILNEAETTQRDAKGRSVLVDLARDVSGVIHRADPNHLVTLGTQSNGAPGASGSDFKDVYGLQGIDFTEVHDYAYWGADAAPMPGARADGSLPGADSAQCQARDAKIACSFAIARALDKPIIVGESGIKATDAASREKRARELGAKVSAAFDAGASGYLVWHLDVKPSDPSDQYAVVPSLEDPLFAAMQQVAEKTSSGTKQ